LPPPKKSTSQPAKPPAPEVDHPLAAPHIVLIGGLVGVVLAAAVMRKFSRQPTPKDWDEPAPLPKDGMLGNFKLGPLLADGGTATVYFGKDENANAVAIKIPHRGPLRYPQFVATFAREAQIGVDLRHPSIVRVLHAGHYRAAGFRRIPYFVMEFLEGQELDSVLKQGPLAEQEAIKVARGVSDALQWAHARGVIHRDISPRNIFITNRRSVKVMDFGISTVTSKANRRARAQGLAYGTPEYMAPERLVDSRAADERSDLYALGCVLYEMIAGHPPFQGNSPEEIVRAHQKAPIPSLVAQGLGSPEVDQLLGLLLAKNPKDRLQSANQVTSRLAELVPMS